MNTIADVLASIAEVRALIKQAKSQILKDRDIILSGQGQSFEQEDEASDSAGDVVQREEAVEELDLADGGVERLERLIQLAPAARRGFQLTKSQSALSLIENAMEVVEDIKRSREVIVDGAYLLDTAMEHLENAVGCLEEAGLQGPAVD